MTHPPIEIKRTDHRSMSTLAHDAWVDRLATANNNSTQLWHYWHAKSSEEKLLAAIVTDIRLLNQDQFPQFNLSVVFVDSKVDLVVLDDHWDRIKVSRHGMVDWDAVYTATLQEVATALSVDYQRGQRWADYARVLGIPLTPVEFTFREPYGSQGVVKTPYGPLSLTFGQDSITAPDRSWSGVPIRIVKDFVDIEDKTGKVHRVRGEEIHPHSGDPSKILLTWKNLGRIYRVRFGWSYIEKDGKRFYALYQVSRSRIVVLSADGERRTIRIEDLTFGLYRL